ncbi:MAG: hypothetical protein H7Z43_08425 [Clostridia bacterium]|nr:hypothetical protein [Deltaproteobacteria bacterium]
MKFVLMVYQGTTPVPGSDRWESLSEAEQKQIYADYAAINKTVSLTPGLPLGLPEADERPLFACRPTTAHGNISMLDLIMEPARLSELDVGINRQA